MKIIQNRVYKNTGYSFPSSQANLETLLLLPYNAVLKFQCGAAWPDLKSTESQEKKKDAMPKIIFIPIRKRLEIYIRQLPTEMKEL